MTIGMLRHRITLQEVVLTPDGSGGFTESWQDIAANPDIPAAVTTLSAAEHARFRQAQVTATHRIYVRYRADITPALRIVREGKIYKIVSAIDREGRKETLEILAESITP